MSFLAMIILGALAGVLASWIMKSPNGILMNVILGIIGAFVGGFIMNLFGESGANGMNLYSLFVSLLGAIVVIALSRMFSKRTIV